MCKYILKVHSTTTIVAVLGELVDVLCLCITELKWLNIGVSELTVMNNYRYPRSCYKMLYELDNVGKTNWETHVKETLFKYGFGHARIAQEVGNIHVY
jgi:hypothetical protein